jgi:C-terminal peptidase prc
MERLGATYFSILYHINKEYYYDLTEKKREEIRNLQNDYIFELMRLLDEHSYHPPARFIKRLRSDYKGIGVSIELADYDRRLKTLENKISEKIGKEITDKDIYENRVFMKDLVDFIDDKELKRIFYDFKNQIISPEGLKIIKVFPGSPAEKAGLKHNESIIAVNGKKLEKLSLWQGVSLIRGAAGSEVLLTIKGADGGVKEVIVKRETIEIPVLESRIIEGKIGYIKIIEFNDELFGRFVEKIHYFTDRKVKGLIIDLRNQPGGLLYVAQLVAQIFLEKGQTIIKIKQKETGEAVDFKLDLKEQANGEDSTIIYLPPVISGLFEPEKTVILVDKMTASAAEILAISLQDYGAMVVGETTFGKGVGQELFNLADGSQLFLTTMGFCSPVTNFCFNKIGVKPDVNAVDDPATEQDEALLKAIEEIKIKEKASH